MLQFSMFKAIERQAIDVTLIKQQMIKVNMSQFTYTSAIQTF